MRKQSLPVSVSASTLLAILLVTQTVSLRASQAVGAESAAEPISLDAIITDAQGRPIRNLSPSDLEVRDDGILQKIEMVEFQRTTEASTPEPQTTIESARDERQAAQRPDVRLIGVFLDEFHVSQAHTARVRDALQRFVDEELRPNDLVVVMKPLDSLNAIRLTRDRTTVRERIRTFEGRQGIYEPRTPFEGTYMTREPAAAEAQRAQVGLSALRSLTIHLGELREGRKTLVFVSEGFVRVARRDGQRLPDVETIVRAANQFDVAIYSADPEPSVSGAALDGSVDKNATEEPTGPRTMLQALAQETGGATLTANDFIGGLRRAARDLDAYYRLTYRPTHAMDARRHVIQVRIKRPGAQITARSSHWALPPDPPRVATRSPSSSILRLPRRPQRISPLIRPWFGLSRGSDGRTRLTFTWEPNARATPVPGGLTLSAVTTDGTVLFEGRVDPIRATGTPGGSTMSAAFEALPGVVQLDMSIRSADGKAIGFDTRDIELPNLSDPRTTLGTPEILRTRTAREFRLLSADLSAPPVASREFARSERLLIRVRAYGSVDERLAVTATLVTRARQELRHLTAVPGDHRVDGMVQFDLPLSSLAIGEYGIEVVARGQSGDAREFVLLRVIG